MNSDPAPPDPALPRALQRQGPPLAWVDRNGRVHWASAAFTRLFGGAAPVGLAERVGNAAAAALLRGEAVELAGGDGQPWRLHAGDDGERWVVWAQPMADAPARRGVGADTDDLELVEASERAARLAAELAVTLEVSGVGLWRMALSPPRVFPDPRGAELVGLPWRPEGYTLQALRDQMHPEDRALAEASAQQTLRTGEPTDMQLRYARPGGGWRHLMLRRALVRDAAGEPTGFIGVLMDVTERVERDRREQDNARRLESAAESAHVGLWSAHLGGEPPPKWTRLTYELLGLDPADPPLPVPEWVARCVHPDDRERVAGAIGSWWSLGNGVREVDFRIIRPSDGALRWLVVKGRIEMAPPTGPGETAATGIAEGVVIDITDRQLALRQLRDALERTQLVNAAFGLGTWRSDVERKHVIWDAQMFRLRGVDSPEREIDSTERRAYVHPDDVDAVVRAQNQRVRDHESWHDVFRVRWPDGRVRWISSHSMPLRDEQGRVEGRIGVNWDSTEQHLAAQALREREVAVAESQAKSQAMSRISHELRTPLNAILGFSRLARSPAGATDAARRAEWLAHVEDAGEHLLALIDDVLELSRAQVGEVRLDLQPVAWDEVVPAALALVAGAADKAGVRLLPMDLPGVVMADPLRLRQVVINLVTNAIKYNRRGGEVRLRAQAGAARLVLHVEDTGRGIAADRLPGAFEPFNRLGAEDGDVEGHGIGLAIVKALVERMGGQVGVRSEPGVGSTFSVELPAAPEDARPPMAPEPGDGEATTIGADIAATAAAAGAATARVLYVEDNPVNALLVQELLALRPAVTLEVAVDGASGLRAARERRPDLILLDMLLPDMGGLEVRRQLASDPRTSHIPCVALSANATRADIDAARAAGFADYWTKPIEFKPFLDGIDALIARRGAT